MRYAFACCGLLQTSAFLMALCHVKHELLEGKPGLDGAGQRRKMSAGVTISTWLGPVHKGRDSARHSCTCGLVPCASMASRDSQRSTNTNRFGSATLVRQS